MELETIENRLGITLPEFVKVMCGCIDISEDYISLIAECVAKEVMEEVCETADGKMWSAGDVRLAFGRVLCRRLNVEV